MIIKYLRNHSRVSSKNLEAHVLFFAYRDIWVVVLSTMNLLA